MSLINKVLEDLDQRGAMAVEGGSLPPQQVRVVPRADPGREWFWWTVAVLMIGAIGWVAWVVYQLQPRALATASAFKVAEDARKRKETAAKLEAVEPEAARSELVKPEAVKPEASKPVAQRARPEAAKPAVSDVLKLAFAIDTPIAARAEPLVTETPVAKAQGSPPAEGVSPAKLATSAPRLEKRNKSQAPSDQAEEDFRRAASLLGQGRVSEAEHALNAALALYPGYEPARQALAALLIEQRRIEEARGALREGLALNPSQPQFAVALARIHAERGDFASALEELKPLQASGQNDAEFSYLMAVVLQRLSRHQEAAEAYQSTLRAAPESGLSWVGLGISLEALQRKPEAADAYHRAIATGTLTAEVRTYAQQRARQLQ